MQSYVQEVGSSYHTFSMSSTTPFTFIYRIDYRWCLEAHKVKKKIRDKSRIHWFDNIDVRDVKYLPSSFNGNVLFLLHYVARGVPSTYGHSMDCMDKICDGHHWCTTKTLNIQNNFVLSFWRSTCVGHIQCHNDYYDYMHGNGGVRNNIEWAGATRLPFDVGNIAFTRSTIECKVCCLTDVCIDLCHTRIIYVHSTSGWMSMACIHLGVHDHPMVNGTCRESLDMIY